MVRADHLELLLLPATVKAMRRPGRRLLPSIGWACCQNLADQPLLVYGERDHRDLTEFDTSIFLLKPHHCTPPGWDAKGILIPRGRSGKRFSNVIEGPVAFKYWDFRRYRIRMLDRSTYDGGWVNGMITGREANWPVPDLNYEELLQLPRL